MPHKPSVRTYAAGPVEGSSAVRHHHDQIARGEVHDGPDAPWRGCRHDGGAVVRQRLCDKLMREGVTLVDPDRTYVEENPLPTVRAPGQSKSK